MSYRDHGLIEIRQSLIGIVILFTPLTFLGQTSAGVGNVSATVVSSARQLNSLTAQITVTWDAGGQKKQSSGSIRLMRPNYADIQLNGDYQVRRLILDGQRRYKLDANRHFKEETARTDGADADDPWWGLPYRFFFTQNSNPFGDVPDPSATVERSQDAALPGGTTLIRRGKAPMEYLAKLNFDTHGVLTRSEVEFGDPAKGGAVFTAELHDVRVNSPMKPTSFSFTPSGDLIADKDPVDELLPIGATVKDFTLPSVSGRKPIKSRETRAAGKLLLLNFWYLNCPPCRLEFPDLEKLYERFHSQGLQMIAIDKGDDAQSVQSYLKRSGLTMPTALGGEQNAHSVFDTFKVQGFPTTYLIDPAGKVIFRAATPDIPELQRQLEKFGFK